MMRDEIAVAAVCITIPLGFLLLAITISISVAGLR
jgi:hypothetical protein